MNIFKRTLSIVIGLLIIFFGLTFLYTNINNLNLPFDLSSISEGINNTVNTSEHNNKVSKKETVKLVRTIDGDTARFITPSYGEVSIRFSGINTTESTTKIEPFGKEASEFTKEKLKAAKLIEVEWDLTQEPSHDRPIGIIYVDGVNLNLLLVREGYADLKYLKDSMPYATEYKEALKEAQQNHKARWQ